MQRNRKRQRAKDKRARTRQMVRHRQARKALSQSVSSIHVSGKRRQSARLSHLVQALDRTLKFIALSFPPLGT
jgi:hypothetical protein